MSTMLKSLLLYTIALVALATAFTDFNSDQAIIIAYIEAILPSPDK